ncbi:hypothetical protein PPL_11742 [Heterostelium album PN500]|uniref:Uncharacterized protein n=1 Tax=Heterostelium pallidum (strain ATCC 26659 / Pp 5 / PN500) TaxID=670386 RepID=D3BUC3_HETP5|nr:hypothetical protein PPL_11742 [Heterostelium album PN500]EFA74711.1 hypothetical protein PPL_11742 [Heterostelium album PN500]|eukprot:XP_020426845.1 hypothetical protein PPL_11742 [Heterostelium album PN500]
MSTKNKPNNKEKQVVEKKSNVLNEKKKVTTKEKPTERKQTQELKKTTTSSTTAASASTKPKTTTTTTTNKPIAKKEKNINQSIKETSKATKTSTKTTNNTQKSNEKIVENKKRKKPVQEQVDSDSDSDENIYNIQYSEDSNSEDEYEDDSENTSDDDDDSDDFNEINVEFDISTVQDNDYHSIKNMMTKLVPWTSDTKFSAGEITDLILEQCKQSNFGRAIRVEHNDDPYGFASVLNHNSYKSSDAIQGYTEYLELKSKQPESQYIDAKQFPKHKQMSAILGDLLSNSKKNQLGLFFSERFLNIPPQLVQPLHQFLHWDLELLVESKINEFKFNNYLFLTTFGVVSGESTDEVIDEKEANKLKQQRKMPEQQPKKLQKTNQKDEYLRQYASAWSTFDIPYEYGNGARWTLECSMNRKGLIMIVPQSNIQSFLNTIKEKLQ